MCVCVCVCVCVCLSLSLSLSLSLFFSVPWNMMFHSNLTQSDQSQCSFGMLFIIQVSNKPQTTGLSKIAAAIGNEIEFWSTLKLINREHVKYKNKPNWDNEKRRHMHNTDVHFPGIGTVTKKHGGTVQLWWAWHSVSQPDQWAWVTKTRHGSANW